MAYIRSWATDLDELANEQIQRVASLPFIYKHVAVMPDAHAGYGSTVGTVIATKGAIVPAAVGVDIGCGMQAVRLNRKIDALPDSLESLRSEIESKIPVGFNQRKNTGDELEWADIYISLLAAKFPNLEKNITKKSIAQLGTLGGGNHFIEICYDQYNQIWIMLHSGSRNIGKSLAEQHINKAKEIMKAYFIDLPDPELAYLAQKTPEFNDYIGDLLWAQKYAQYNRNFMMKIIMDIFIEKNISADIGFFNYHIDCHHNYSQLENHFGSNVWVTRKGAVSAREGELGIIPGSMGTQSYIVKGKGNPDSFNSCSHGAGRKMSRKKARENFTIQDLKEQTKGIFCRKDDQVIDEIPGAYKDIAQVMRNQADLVDIIFKLKQLICIKG